MLNMIKGAYAPKAKNLKEAFEIQTQVIHANVNAEKIEELFKDFIAMHSDEPLFFILEIPCNINEEEPDELMKGNYNVCTMFSKNEQAVRGFFEKHNIPVTDKLITAWDTFDKEHPGVSSSLCVSGERIEDLVTYFREWGIYLAERRPE